MARHCVIVVAALAFASAAQSQTLSFTLKVPRDFAAVTTNGAHLLVSPDALTNVRVRALDVLRADDVDALLAQLPREPSATTERYVVAAPKRGRGGTWTVAMEGSTNGTATQGTMLVRLFEGRGAVMLLGVTLRGAKRAPLESLLRKLAGSIEVGKGGPGGALLPAKPTRLSSGQAGPWRLSWSRDWQRADSGDESVSVRRTEPSVMIIAQLNEGVRSDDDTALARRPFPLGEQQLAPVGEAAVAENGVTNEWANDTVSLLRHSRCSPTGCFWIVASASTSDRFVQQNALLWFVQHAERSSSATPAVAAETPRERGPTSKKRASTRRDSPLGRRIAGNRLHYRVTTSDRSDGVFVGGVTEREVHFCDDGGAYSISRKELVATGYESGDQRSRAGTWTLTAVAGREAVAIAWNDGVEDTFMLVNDPGAAIDAALAVATPEQRRQVEALTHGLGPYQLVMLRLGAPSPEVFQVEPSDLCDG